jgi:anaerobic magnesium-protoporphyrin IX monomethyl ester cyclase
MKIALINPRVESYSSTIPPLGLLTIAAMLEKEGYTVRLFDIYPYNDRDIPKVVEFQPDVVGITVLTDYLERALHVGGKIRLALPKAFFLIGGVHVTALPEESMRAFGAHAGVLGEGEYTMLQLCGHLRDRMDWRSIQGIVYPADSRGFIVTPRRPYIEVLDEIPFPARHLLNFEDYLIPPGIIRGHWSERSTTVMTGRGCPFQCIWCGSQCTFGHKVRYRSISNVIAELQQLIRDYRIDTVWLVDDTFTLSKKRVLEFCAAVRENNIRLTLGCQAHVTTADEEMFREMKRTGFVQVDFGVESGSDRVLKTLKKHSNETAIRQAFACAKKAGLRTMATFMFGSPEEKEEDVEATMRLARAIYPDFVSSFFITPYPGTELMEMSLKHGWIRQGERSSFGLKKEPMLQAYFAPSQLKKIRSRFQAQFAFRNFAGLFFSPKYMFRALTLVARYPMGLVLGIRKYFKTFVLDDLIFEFLVYYVRERANRCC